MNMKKIEILETALSNLEQNLKIKGYWSEFPKGEMDATVTIELPNGKRKFETIVKKEIRTNSLSLLNSIEKKKDFLLIAYRIYPKYKKLLQDSGINYLEANGDIFIKNESSFILIDRNPPLKELESDSNRAFTKAGLRVFFILLMDNSNLFATQRELAEKAGVALGNIPLIIKGLRGAGLLLKKNSLGYQWSNKEEAIEQWILGYRNTLKPSLYKGKFKLSNNKDWKEIPLPNTGTYWGGEPGGDILTNYLRPEKLILFTDLKKTDFIKSTRLLPDQKGEIDVYQTFWSSEKSEAKNAPPILIYADLIINGDKRSLETAQKIYEQYITEL